MAGFNAMAKGAMVNGALSEKHKELIALAIGVRCIGFHIQALRRLGATQQELEETLAVAVYVGGGPSLMNAAEALQAWDQFAAQRGPPGHFSQPRRHIAAGRYTPGDCLTKPRGMLRAAEAPSAPGWVSAHPNRQPHPRGR